MKTAATMRIAARGALLAAAPLLTAAPLLAGVPAHAAPVAPTPDATCVLTAHGTFTAPVDQGGTDTPQADTLRMTGTVKCVDAAGEPLAAGTFERTVTMPRTECTGDEHGDTSSTAVRWEDGTTSTFTFDRTDVEKADGTASLAVTGSVTADSAHFADDGISGSGTSSGTGCGTRDGERTVDSTLVLRLTR